MKHNYSFLFILFLLAKSSNAQVDSIYHEGGYRTFILHLPATYNAANSYPLILNFHGLNSNALEQELYTGFDAIADTAGFIVVYPQGLNNSWNLLTGYPDDVDFTSALIDSLEQDYSIDSSCIYSTGMSLGGFMTYLLACKLSGKLAAVAPVAGNMIVTKQSDCFPVKGMPLLEIHGDADYVVSYNGTFGIPPVPETIAWWVSTNSCDTPGITTPIPDINTGDSCTATKTTYSNGEENSEVIHYRIINGGHTWPGAIPVAVLGNTCQDFNASVEIWKFFRKYCATISSVDDVADNGVKIYPNPFTDEISIHIQQQNSEHATIVVRNIVGQTVFSDYETKLNTTFAKTIDLSKFGNGVYFLDITFEGERIVKKIVKQ
ncbi:MAG TPA: T9SS type A sorting domain-containing protein [Chitinophagales bacterium]|nr:T9SS type A sorting domain-containing protein [Chitinophagales bacterium]